MTCAICERASMFVCLSVRVHGVKNPPANEKALCRVQPYRSSKGRPFDPYCQCKSYVDITE